MVSGDTGAAPRSPPFPLTSWGDMMFLVAVLMVGKRGMAICTASQQKREDMWLVEQPQQLVQLQQTVHRDAVANDAQRKTWRSDYKGRPGSDHTSYVGSDHKCAWGSHDSGNDDGGDVQ